MKNSYLLKEWLDSKGNRINTGSSTGQVAKTSGGFKERFKKLLDYASKHKGPAVHKTTIKSLSDDGFFYTEERRGGYSFYDVDINVYIGELTEAWRLRVYIDNKPEADLSGTGWPELLKQLRAYITVPVPTTPEYKDLLTEWVDAKGNKVSTSTSSKATSKIPDQTARFKSLLSQIDSDGFCKYTVNVLDGNMLSITLHNKVKVTLVRRAFAPVYALTIENHREVYDDYEDVLKALIEEGIIGETDLCESTLAEDFQLYESLWN